MAAGSGGPSRLFHPSPAVLPADCRLGDTASWSSSARRARGDRQFPQVQGHDTSGLTPWARLALEPRLFARSSISNLSRNQLQARGVWTSSQRRTSSSSRSLLDKPAVPPTLDADLWQLSRRAYLQAVLQKHITKSRRDQHRFPQLAPYRACSCPGTPSPSASRRITSIAHGLSLRAHPAHNSCLAHHPPIRLSGDSP